MLRPQKQNPPTVTVKPPVKKENQWYDVGVVKVTNMVVTHFYMPSDDSAYVEVRHKKLVNLLYCVVFLFSKTKYLCFRMILAQSLTTAR